jgi:S1-C subfamily serine protease
VKFFEPADVGLTVEDLPRQDKANTEGVLLKDVRKDSPFASHLRNRDVITDIEDKKTPTTAIFRRVLRRKLAEGGPSFTLTLRRSGKSVEVTVPVKD